MKSKPGDLCCNEIANYKSRSQPKIGYACKKKKLKRFIEKVDSKKSSSFNENNEMRSIAIETFKSQKNHTLKIIFETQYEKRTTSKLYVKIYYD